MKNRQIHAAFVVAPIRGGFAATTRAADRGEEGRIGLPGGKVDPGEIPCQAAMREAAEEGWLVAGIMERPFRVAKVEGKWVAWFFAEEARRLEEYKERHRGIMPFIASWGEIAESGYGNRMAMAAYGEFIEFYLDC